MLLLHFVFVNVVFEVNFETFNIVVFQKSNIYFSRHSSFKPSKNTFKKLNNIVFFLDIKLIIYVIKPAREINITTNFQEIFRLLFRLEIFLHRLLVRSGEMKPSSSSQETQNWANISHSKIENASERRIFLCRKEFINTTSNFTLSKRVYHHNVKNV